jgi:EmrB/QacA subfamily drug resistance transporter
MKVKHPKLTLAVISLSYLMLTVDLSIAITALPQIKMDLSFSSASLSWIQNAYTLVFGGLLLLGSRIGDIFGRRKMYIWGLAFFMLASLLVALAPDAGTMIAARVLQGLGAAILGPSSLALLSTSFPDQPQRGKAMAIYGSITGIGPTLGLVLGGWIASTWDWRWAFLINIPVGILLMFASHAYLNETEKQISSVDVWGALLSTVGMGSIVYGLIHSAEFGWSNLISWTCLGFGALAVVAFVKVEQEAVNPLVPLRLFKSRQRSGANIARALFVGSMSAYWFYTSLFLQTAKGMSPLATGLAFLPMTLASFAIAFFVPRLSRRFGDGPFLAGGLLTVAVGTFWLSRLTPTGNYFLEVALPMLLIGFGQGASTIRLTSAGVSGVSPKDAGAASGLVTMHVQLAQPLFLSILIAIAALVPAIGLTESQLIAKQANVALAGGAILCLVSLATVLIFVIPNKHQEEK